MEAEEIEGLSAIPVELPAHAVEEVIRRWENGAKREAIYRVGGEEVWLRHWDESGQLDGESGRSGGMIHGSYRNFINGRLHEESFYYHGKEHGTARQYDDEGNLIGTYTMQYGTGLDVWYERAGVLAEERECRDGAKHGFERWYSEDGTVRREGHFKHYGEHGIFRKWNDTGGIRRGFPQYFVDGIKVTKRQYLAACKRDASLPPFRAEDNDFHRAPLQVLHRDNDPCDTVSRTEKETDTAGL